MTTKTRRKSSKLSKWDDYKSRKLVLTFIVIMLSSALVLAHIIADSIWKDVVISVFSVFMMGHVGEKIGTKFADKNNNGIPDDQE